MVSLLPATVRYPVVRQYHVSDCGPACLVAVARYFGARVPLPTARERTGTNQGGTTLLGLKEGAQSLGFQASGASGSYDDLLSVQCPCIAHVVRDGLVHFVVMWESDSEGVLIGDPARGLERLSRHAFEAIWVTRTVLLLEPAGKLVDEGGFGWGRWVGSRLASSSDWLIQAVFLGTIYTGLGLLASIIIQRVIDSALPARNLELVGAAAGALFLIFLGRGLVRFVRERFVLRLNRVVSQDLAEDFLRRLFLLPAQFFDSRRRGDITARLQDASRIQTAVLQLLGGGTVDGMTVIGSLCLVFYFSSTLGVLLVIVLPLYGLLAAMATQRIRRDQQRALATYGTLQAEYVDALDGVEAVRGSGASSKITDKHLRLFANHQGAVERLGLTSAAIQSVLESVGGALLLAALLLGAVLVVDGSLSLGRMLAAYSLAGVALPSLQRVIQSVFDLQSASAAADRIQDVLLSPPEQLDQGEAIAAVETLEIRGGSFRWPGQPPHLARLDLTLRCGEVVGLVGGNGAGKSTLVGILARRYPLTAGHMRVNGRPALETRLSDHRRLVQLVPENVAVFNGSLAENLTLGLLASPAVGEAVEGAMRQFLRRFPGGAGTSVGEGGRRLSAGERQFLGLLRAMLVGPDVLLLDEALAPLDGDLKGMALDLLRYQVRRGAVLIVSHDPQDLALAHRVLVLRDGVLEDLRSHERISERPAV